MNRVQKMSEGANIKLATVASNVLGVSARAMLEAMVGGIEQPEQLAELARGRLRDKLPALEEALAGRLGQHQCFLLSVQLHHIDEMDTAIATVGDGVEARLRSFQEAAQRLMTIPGVGQKTAPTILTKVGPDVSRFPTGAHLASWAAVCPGNHESAGKQKSGRTRKGSPWLKAALVEAAQAASRTKSYLGAQYHRLASRRGKRLAALAVAIHCSSSPTPCSKWADQDLGTDYFDQRVQKRLVRRLQALGYSVSLEP